MSTIAQAGPQEIHFQVNTIEVEGDNPLDEERTRELLAPYAHTEHTLKTLLETAKSLEADIRNSGYAFHRVILPPQTLSDGVVHLEVVAFRLGHIEFEDNAYFDATNLRASLPPLEEGETLNMQEVSRALRFANRHAFKDVDVLFRQGEGERQVDATLVTRARDPQNFYLVLNNTGTEETGRSRLSAIYQNANLWDRDHEVLASFTTSPENVSDVLQFGLSYSLPLYSVRGRLEGFGVYSNIDSGRVADFDIAGAGTLYDLTYSQNLPGTEHYYNELKLGFTDKLFVNDVQFEGTQLGTDIRSRPLALQYAGEYQGDGSELSFNLQWNYNLPGGSHSSQLDYDANRLGAPRDWQALRLYATLDQALAERFLLRARLNAQYSKDPLISGEQIGIGGIHSVRGYEEREITGDSGYALGLELWWPNLWGSFSPYGFVDTGARTLEDALEGEDGHKSLSSIGLGADWRALEGLSVTVDLAYALDDAVETEKGDVRAHFNLIYRF